ncbi:hypothetical protein TcYC6_0013910 [Trypanosoma cruzi]|nr:hypothetical protein TcYC6_0013910 [Trypanosoma cruzi]
MTGPYEWAAKLPSRVLFSPLIGVEVVRGVSCGGSPDVILLARRGRQLKDALGTSLSSVTNGCGGEESCWARRGPRNASVAAMAEAGREH